MKNILAVDTGKGGGMVYNLGPVIYTHPFKEDEHLPDRFRALHFDHVLLEKATATRQQGVVSAFSTGENFGNWKGILAWIRPPENEVEIIMSQKWIRWFKESISSGEPPYPERTAEMKRDKWYAIMKKYNKEIAQLRFPDLKVTNAVADALLIHAYAMQKYG